MKSRRKIAILTAALAALHLVVLAAGFFAPYDAAMQNRDLPFAPPTHLHFVDAQGRLSLRPSVCPLEPRPGTFNDYVEDVSTCAPLTLFTEGNPYLLFGVIHARFHLFGVSGPVRVHLLGTDSYGRDVLSRLIYGGQVSLSAGLLATLLAVTLGSFLGTISGYFGGWLDSAVMRFAELFLALPWLYLLLSLRAWMPLSLNSKQAFLLVIAVIGAVGWARPARLIRSVVLSSREQHYVLAARLFGGSHAYVIRRHIIPDIYSVMLTQAVVLIPQYVLAEVTLSFLGLGIGEPTPSWGNMLSVLQQYSVLVSYWWMFLPGLLLAPVFLGYVLLASELQLGRVARQT